MTGMEYAVNAKHAKRVLTYRVNRVSRVTMYR
jgi:hypothetical protein